jgi:hypothetical protein
MIGETQEQQAPASSDLDFSTITPIDSGKPANAGSTLRQSVAFGVQQNPDEYAKLLKQQQVTGMSPEAARPFANDTQNAIDVERLNPEGMVDSHPRTAQWATNPDNAAVSGADELHRLTRIEQHAASMRAYTPTWEDKVSDAAQSAYEFMGGSGSLKQRAFQYPLARAGVGVLRGTEELLGNAASFAGLHGNNPAGLNFLQRSARTLEPQNFGEDETGLDKLAANIGPMVPALMVSGGTSLIARTLGLTDKAAKVLAGLSVGGVFTADQGGRTYNAMREQGASDYEARIAANRVAAVSAPGNALFGATDVLPVLRDNPLLTSIGLGGITGVTGQLGQNWATGRPLTDDLGKATIEGAAVQGGMHLGMGTLEDLAHTAELLKLHARLGAIENDGGFHATVKSTIDEVEASQLRLRSPEKFDEVMQSHFEGDQSFRIPAQEFVNYFVGKDIDPSVMANRAGVQNLTEAAAAGADLEIPKANFFGRLEPEHQHGLFEDLIDPSTDMTLREARAGHQELQDWVANGGPEKLQADFAAADQETQATPEWQKVYTDLKQRYVDAGEPETAADGYATLQANAIANLAKRAGLKADELLALHNPKVVAGDAPSSGQPRFQDAIDGIRSVVEAAKQEGDARQKASIAPAEPWLVDAAKENGLDIAGHNHVIDGSAVRHVLNRHSDEGVESSRGQLPVTDADFERIPDLVGSPDAVVFGTKTRGKRDQIGYIKRLEDGNTLYLEEVRTGRKELAAVSMRKYPAAKDFDSIAGTLPSNARSDGGDVPIVIRNPNTDKKAGPILNQSAFHGSPYDFDRFSLDHMSKGEGGQAYGWGLYFAGEKSVADYYRKTLSEGLPFIDGKPIDPTNPGHVAAGALEVHGGDKSAAIEDLNWTIDHPKLFPDGAAEVARKAIAKIESGKKLPKAELRGGQLYEAEIPDDHLMLDHDKPLSEQSAAVKKALEGLDSELFKSHLVGMPAREIEPTGGEIYRRLSLMTKGPKAAADEAASRALHSIGIEGIRYLDRDSRAEGDGTHNYVVFDDNAISILKTYYQDDTPKDKPENLDIRAIMAAHTDSKGLSQGAASDDLTDRVKAALDAGKKVTLYSDGKPIDIVAINRGMMQDAKGQRWGTLSLFTDPDAKLGNRVEISSATPAELPAADEGKRGWFRVLPDGRYEIGKTKIGDFSTFIHEPAHAYLELFRELTQREGASDELKLDFKKIADWLGTTPEEAYTKGFTRNQHEQWARANEQYVRDGQAPTSGLQRAFHNFATWLGSIYRRASALGVELSSDIRGVMDRLYAGDTAVDRAEQEAGRQQLFESPEEAGWTEEEFRNYARGRGVEEEEARKLILSEMRDAAKRERTESWRVEKSSVRDAITTEVDKRPEYTAIRSLRRGTLDDGTALSLNRDMLIKQFGEQRVKDLQQLHRGLYRTEGGTDAETAAELFGFGSGEEMMRALEKGAAAWPGDRAGST